MASNADSINPDPTCDPNYNSTLKSQIQETFVHFVIPENVLPVILRYNILTVKDQDRIKAFTINNGNSVGAEVLLDRISRYQGWFDVLQEVLRDDAVRLVHVADQLNVIKEKTYEKFFNRKSRKVKLAFPFKVKKKHSSSEDQVMIEKDDLKKQIVELTKQFSLLRIQFDEAKADADEVREVCKKNELHLDNLRTQYVEITRLNSLLYNQVVENTKEAEKSKAACQKLKREKTLMEKEILRQQKLENKLKITIKSLPTRLEIIRHRAENETPVSDNTHEGYVSLEEMLLMELCKLEKDWKDIKLDDEIDDDTQSTASAAVDDPTPAVRAHVSHLSHLSHLSHSNVNT